MTEFLKRKDLDGGVAQVVLERPPVNALNPIFLKAIHDLLTEIESDPGVRAVVITSGLPVFSAGMDLKEAQEFSDADQIAVVDGLNATLYRLYGMTKPVITAANGAAIAGGLFFVLASDYTVAREGAKFGLTEVRVGLNFPVAPLQIARAELSPAVRRRLMTGGRNVDAEAARQMGILDEVVSADALIPRAMDVARDYASIPPLAYAAVKTQLRTGALAIIKEAIDSQNDPSRKGWFTDETRIAMKALLAAATRKS
jgi:enoyl-CoA hydratase